MQLHRFSASTHLIVAFTAGLFSLHGTAAETVAVYRGEYFHNFETSAFTPEGETEPWCVSAVEMKNAQMHGSKAGRAQVVVRGSLSPEGKYCNLGAYKRVLKVEAVLEVKNLTNEP